MRTMANMTDVQAALRAVAETDRVTELARFFKTGSGEYAEGDKFIGVRVPNVRAVIKDFKDLPLAEVEKLLVSPWHEERLAALLMLVQQYRAADEAGKKAVYDIYLAHTRSINNWDLVDASAEFIVGPYLEHRSDKMSVLRNLAMSDLLWERRIAMLATFDYIRKARADEALVIAELLLHDNHDLIQKAVGWMLREIGKRVNQQTLLGFLDTHAATMPRTTLRYAIEHLPPEQRLYYMKQKEMV